MKNCAIIIYNYESNNFLRAAIRQIRKFKHPEIEQRIIISEQSSEETALETEREFGGDADILIVKMKALYSGYSIDYILRYVDIWEEYLCTLDVDAFPIHPNWLYLPISLLTDFTFAGIHADLEHAYAKYGKFYCMAQQFRVGRTKDFMELALAGGFTKYTYRKGIDVPMTFSSSEWDNRAIELNEDGWADDSVVAHWWEDQHKQNDKFTFAITHTIGKHGEEPLFGRIVDGLVFHFSFSFTSIGVEEQMGPKYWGWRKRIDEDFSDELIGEMIAAAEPIQSPIPRQIWDGKKKEILPVPKELNDKIDALK